MIRYAFLKSDLTTMSRENGLEGRKRDKEMETD